MMLPVKAFLKKKNLYLSITRYLLGMWMMPYAISKIFCIQFAQAATSLQNLDLPDSGKSLTWAFLGHTTWFEILLGFFELIPSILLFFRRTTLLGAILMFPVSLNVLLINYAFNLWDETKMLAVLLFSLNCAIFVFKWTEIKMLYHIIIGKGVKFNFIKTEGVINLALLVVLFYLIIKGLSEV